MERKVRQAGGRATCRAARSRRGWSTCGLDAAYCRRCRRVLSEFQLYSSAFHACKYRLARLGNPGDQGDEDEFFRSQTHTNRFFFQVLKGFRGSQVATALQATRAPRGE